ncbi:MAG: class IV adenylate cyclase [Pirellulales bacterium]|nr:class IV adenylate cyclase [Pirellulales bacterium]
MIEIEQKFRVQDTAQLAHLIISLGGDEKPSQLHQDTYYNHPGRDFAETREALRVRRVDGVPWITYKGTLLPGHVKARRELEWQLSPGDDDGSNTETLLELLGFRRVATVEKHRRPFTLSLAEQTCCVVIDRVTSLGDFAELELIVEQTDDVEAARANIDALAGKLKLDQRESRSYLAILLDSRAAHRPPPNDSAGGL